MKRGWSDISETIQNKPIIAKMKVWAVGNALIDPRNVFTRFTGSTYPKKLSASYTELLNNFSNCSSFSFFENKADAQEFVKTNQEVFSPYMPRILASPVLFRVEVEAINSNESDQFKVTKLISAEIPNVQDSIEFNKNVDERNHSTSWPWSWLRNDLLSKDNYKGDIHDVLRQPPYIANTLFVFQQRKNDDNPFRLLPKETIDLICEYAFGKKKPETRLK